MLDVRPARVRAKFKMLRRGSGEHDWRVTEERGRRWQRDAQWAGR